VADIDEGQSGSQNSENALRRARARRAIPKRRSVFILDDDAGEVEAVRAVLEADKFNCTTFTNPRQCLDGLRKENCDALVCDLVMPDVDGLHVLAESKSIRPSLPVIVITGHGNIAVAVTAMKNGAAHFIEKPFDRAVIVEAVNDAMASVERSWSATPVKLSKMEKIVLKHVLQGNGNKHIALMIGRSVRTVEDHRSHLMKKMGVENIVELVKRSISLGLA
jgi:two-component system, LuxR family, response regulator FixJ